MCPKSESQCRVKIIFIQNAYDFSFDCIEYFDSVFVDLQDAHARRRWTLLVSVRVNLDLQSRSVSIFYSMKKCTFSIAAVTYFKPFCLFSGTVPRNLKKIFIKR